MEEKYRYYTNIAVTAKKPAVIYDAFIRWDSELGWFVIDTYNAVERQAVYSFVEVVGEETRQGYAITVSVITEDFVVEVRKYRDYPESRVSIRTTLSRDILNKASAYVLSGFDQLPLAPQRVRAGVGRFVNSVILQQTRAGWEFRHNGKTPLYTNNGNLIVSAKLTAAADANYVDLMLDADTAFTAINNNSQLQNNYAVKGYNNIYLAIG